MYEWGIVEIKLISISETGSSTSMTMRFDKSKIRLQMRKQSDLTSGPLKACGRPSPNRWTVFVLTRLVQRFEGHGPRTG